MDMKPSRFNEEMGYSVLIPSGGGLSTLGMVTGAAFPSSGEDHEALCRIGRVACLYLDLRR
jgi:hypothetical protein